MFSAALIDDKVWLGDILSSKNKSALDALNITHILSVLGWKPKYDKIDKRIRKYVIAADDDTTDLLPEFEPCYEFIDQAVKNNCNVLIHCQAGISRSATIAASYLMKKYDLTFADALKRLQSKR
ncbi:unnamed protein product, partial [Didymodactylos carnosus]